MHVVTNWSERASSFTIAACAAMNSVVSATGSAATPGRRRARCCRPAATGRPSGEPVRPVDEAPALVERRDVAVALAQPVDEGLERAAVVEQLHPRLVVDLVADDRRVVGVAADDLADDPRRRASGRRVRVVGVLAVAVGDRAAPVVRSARHLRVLAGQPRRDRVGRGSEDHLDAARVGAVEHRLEPVELEMAVLGFPRRPDRLADADDGEIRPRAIRSRSRSSRSYGWYSA